MGDRSHILLISNENTEERKETKRKKEVWALEISGPQAENVNQKKLNMRLSVARGIQNQITFPNSVFIYKSYSIKYLINVAYGNRN